MSVGKSSIKRASAANKKTVKPVINESVVKAEEVQVEFVPETSEMDEKIRPVRLKEEMPVFLL